MEQLKLKREMMRLWKDTFHDSDAYISLVFDNYFNEEYIAYHEENGALVSSLLGVPYTFVGNGGQIRGLYLCGLATRESMRGSGVMTRLLEEINRRAAEAGFAFTFLIPASQELRIHYMNHGYRNASYLVEDRYTNAHDFDNDFLSTLYKFDDRVKDLKTASYKALQSGTLSSDMEEARGKIIDFIHSSEDRENKYTGLLHSCKDLEAVIAENILGKGEIIYTCTSDGDITGVLFATYCEPHNLSVQKMYYSDSQSYYKLLAKLKSQFPDDSFGVMCYPEQTNRQALWSMVYGAENPDGVPGGAYGTVERVYNVNQHAKPFGMARILSYSEILKFLTNGRNDCEFSILVKEAGKEGKSLYAVAGHGKFKMEEDVEPENVIKRDKRVSRFSKRDIDEILFRKRDSSPAIMEAFGIPRLALNFSLMLE